MVSLKTLEKEAEKKLGKNIVFGEGPSNAKVVIVGEGPGKTELKLKRPFVGRAGKFLDEVLKHNKIGRKKIYITSVLKNLPKKITTKEIEKNKQFLLEQIKLIKPKVIILFGNLALKTVLNLKPITKYHGRIIKKENIICMPTFHPAAAMRFPKIKKKFKKDMKKIAKIISS